MGQKDMQEKKLGDYNEVFADIFNTLFFKRPELDPACLKSGPTNTVYKAEEQQLHEQRRDTMKEYRNAERYVISSYGIENQSQYDEMMPVRVMGYDYGSYRQQIIEGKRPLHPVVTIVLNFSERRWGRNKDLHELLELTEEQAVYVQNYGITVFDIAFLEDEEIERFESDFKIVARFFKDRRMGKRYSPKEVVKHIEEVAEFLTAFTGDERYRGFAANIQKNHKKGEESTMCWMLDSWIDEGREKEAKLNAKMFLKNGVSLELVAASITFLSKEKLQEIYEEVQNEKMAEAIQKSER